MAKLYFRVASDWEEVVRLRQEIDKLKATLKSMDSTQSPAAFKTLNNQLSEATKKMDGMVTEAAKAGAKIEGGFKKKIFDASQVVNGLTEKITLQRGVIQQLRNELSGLKDKYKEALKVDGDVNGIATRIKSVSARLSEQKAVLFGLTQQQAGARLNVKKLRDEYELYNNEGKEVNDTNESLALSWEKVIGVLGGATALKAFVSEMVNVRGQFQDLEISFGTMLKSKEKADKLMAELVDIAAKTPFDLQGIASSAKQMLAYGSSVENVGKELVMLGNVAAGVGSQLGDIAYLYGTLRTQGRAYAVDIRQFAGRGIPIYEELAKVMGRNKDEISDLVSQGKVGFKEVEQAFQNMTKEGGMYFNLMENRSKSLTGQISNLGDAWDSMLNEMGKKGEGVFYASISAAKGLVENYEKVGMVIEGLVITYGAYKTALMVNIALEKVQAAQRLASIKGVTAMKMATDLMTGSVARLNKVLMLNPYALVGAAAIASSVYLLKWADNQDKCTEASERFEKAEEASKKAREDRNKKVSEYIRIASDEKRTTDERKGAIDALKGMYKGLIPQYDQELFLLKNIAEYKEKINEEELRNERIGTKTKLILLDRDIAKYEAGLKEATKQGAGQTAQSLMNIIKDLKDDRAKYERKLKELESEASGSGADSKEEKVKNKAYWEKQKKDAQAAIDAIDSISRKKLNAGNYNGVKKEDKNLYLESKKKIKEAEKHLKVYERDSIIQKAADKELHAQEKLNEQLLSLQLKNQQDEVALMDEGREKKLAKINADFEAQRQAIKKQAKKLADANKEAKTKGLNKDGLTAEQQAEIDKANELNVKSREKAENDVYRGELEAMRNYLKEYGTFQQQKLAIAEEYADRISKAQTQGEKMSLQREKENALKTLESEFSSRRFNWESIFGDLSLYSSDKLRGLREELRELLETDRKLSESDKIKLIEQYNKLGDAIIKDENALAGLFSLKSEQENQIELLEQEYELRQKIYNNLKNEQAAVNSRHQNDKINLENFLKQNGIDLSASYSDIISIFNKSGNTEGLNEFNRLFSLFGKSGKELDEVTEKVGEAGQSMEGASEALQGAGESAGATIGIIDKIIHKVNDNVQSANELLQVLELDDTKFGQGFSAFAKSSEYATQAWGSLKSGNVMGVVTGVVGSIKELGNAFGTWFGPNGTAYYEKVREELENINEIHDSIIDKSREDIQFGGGVQAIEAATLALDNYNKKVENLHKIAAASGRAGASWKNHSAEWHSNKNVGAVGGFQQMSQLLDKSITSMTDLYSLSGDELYLIMTQMPEAWGLIDERIRENLNSIIECKDEGEELKESLREAMTGVTYDSFFGGFIDNLADMSTSFEDMCDNFEDSLRKSIIAGLVSKQYKDEIRKLYEDWSKYAESDDIDKDESNNLKKRYQKLVQSMIAERDEMSKTFGWESEKKQEASRGFGSSEMTHEDAGELSGRFAALQVAGEEIKAHNIEQTKNLNILALKVDSLLSANVEMRNIADDTRNIIANSYLELMQISENTGAIVKPIIQIQKDIEEVKRNTSRL